MLSVKGVYEEGKVTLLEKVQLHKRSNVIVTFVEEQAENKEDENLRIFTANAGALSFWEDDAENIYQDYLPKPKK